MDLLYGSDQKLGDMDDEMGDFLDNDVFQTQSVTTPDSYMDNEWFNSFFEDPVLNDKMITDAVQPPRITSEHSYSSTQNEHTMQSPLELVKLEDLDSDLFTPANNALDLTVKQGSHHIPMLSRSESNDLDPVLCTATVSPTTITAHTFSVNNKQQPTIILATSTGQTTLSAERSVLPKITVKQEPPDVYDCMEQTMNVDSLVLPPTPPSSSTSDSDSCHSPQNSAPSSPIRQLSYSRQLDSSSSSYSSSSSSWSPTDSSRPFMQPLFTNPIPQSGILVLSEEEKRTLISEGYPIPGKLPLTKQEEKNLKKIRRKIKNKISAQESRRKKKEYLETLEKRVESFSHENCDLKKKVDSLENNNRSLLGQLHKLQSLVGKIPRPGAVPQTGTALMVLVLCFAVFVGSWSPISLNIGYAASKPPVLPGGPSLFSSPQLVNPAPMMGPPIERAKVDAYCTPNMKSRVLLSLRGDQEEMWYDPYGPNIPDGGHEKDEMSNSAVAETMDYGPEISKLVQDGETVENEVVMETEMKVKVVTMDARFGQNNDSADSDRQALLHPDLDVIADRSLLQGEGHSAMDHREKIETA